MAKLTKTGAVAGSPIIERITAAPEGKYDSAFDSSIKLTTHAGINHRIRIALRLFLNPITPNQLNAAIAEGIAKLLGVKLNNKGNVGFYPDADSNPQLIADWRGTDWQNFVNKFKSQAMSWNRKFWLIPPADFTLFDTKFAGLTYRANICCEFWVEVVASIGTSHRTIDVVNLFSPNATSSTFRSHEGLYDSKDVGSTQAWSQDMNMQWQSHEHYTVIHEVGHAIGLPHIGVIRGLPNCSLAIVADKWLPADYVPALLKGGSNGATCYGYYGSGGDAENVMGYGVKFAPENAQPWLDRLQLHANGPIDITKWKVSMSKIPPKRV